MSIREARPGDWPGVASLLAELGRPDVRGTGDEEPARRVYVSYLSREDTAAFVAEEDDGAIVGFVDVELRTRLNFVEPQAWIPDLIVAGSARSSGVGATLLARAEEFARDRGAWGMALESANWRTRAHAFYEREGWKDAARAFTKSLSDRPWPPAPPGESETARR